MLAASQGVLPSRLTMKCNRIGKVTSNGKSRINRAQIHTYYEILLIWNEFQKVTHIIIEFGSLNLKFNFLIENLNFKS